MKTENKELKEVLTNILITYECFKEKCRKDAERKLKEPVAKLLALRSCLSENEWKAVDTLLTVLYNDNLNKIRSYLS